MQNCIFIRDRYSTLEYSEMFQYVMESASLQPIEQIYIQYYTLENALCVDIGSCHQHITNQMRNENAIWLDQRNVPNGKLTIGPKMSVVL